MKAVVKFSKGYGNIEVREVADPVCGDDEVKIEVKATGVCGTDLHVMHDTFATTPPVIMGHEFCGSVVEVGSKVKRFRSGDRVVAENVIIGCGECEMCLTGHYAICPSRGAQGLNVDGGFAKYVVCKEKFVYKIPDNISYEEGAMAEPLTCCAHAVLDETKVGAGDIVLVTGPGAIGILCAQLAKSEGGFVIITGTNADEERLKIAKELGVDVTVNIQKEDIKKVVNELTGGRGVDVVIECSGVEAAVDQGLELVKKRGKYTQVGLFGKKINFDIEKVVWKELKFTGAISHTRDAWIRGLRLVEQGKVNLKPLVTNVYSILEWEKAFDDFEKKKGIKLVLTPID